MGHAYVNVDWMNGRLGDSEASVEGRGTCSGKFGFEVAEVGSGGSEMTSGVSPGIMRATTLLIERGFCGADMDI